MNRRAIERKLDRIRSLGLDELRLEWRRLYHSGAPRISRDLLILGLGYRLQEIEQGGLGMATRRKLQTIAKALRTTGRVGATPSLSLKPGARLVREWHRDVIVALALKYNIPTVVNTRQTTESGGLMSYALDIPDLFRRSAGYVDRVLKGAKPADLPVQAPTKFELTINLKTARALGRTIPQWLLANADTVIE